MTKKRLFLFIHTTFTSLLSHNVFAESQVVKNISFSTKANAKILQEQIQDSEWNFSADTELALQGITAKVAWQTDATNFSSSPDFHQPAWGVSAFLKDFSMVPLTLKFGQISAGGSVSKLNSPALSSVANPLSSFSAMSSALTANLPASSSWKKNISGAAIFDLKNSKTALRRLYFSSFYDEEDKFIASTLISLNFKKILEASFSYTGGRFFYGSESSSWFSKTPLFKKDYFFCQNIQIALKSKWISTKFSSSIFQSVLNPKDDFDYTISFENSFYLKDFQLFLAGFHASSPYIFTASGNHLCILNQFKISPQQTFFLPRNFAKLKTGLSLYAEEKIQTDGTRLLSAKIATATDFRTKNSDSKFQFAISGLELGSTFHQFFNSGIQKIETQSFENAIYSISLNFNFFSKWKPLFSYGYSYYPNKKKHSYKGSVKIQIPAAQYFSFKAGFSASSEETVAKASILDLSLNYRFKQKKLQISAAFGINYKFTG